MSSSSQTSGVETTSTCSGVTTNSIVQCSPTSAPAAGWVVAASRASGSNQIAVMPVRVLIDQDINQSAASWTTGFQCVAFVP